MNHVAIGISSIDIEITTVVSINSAHFIYSLFFCSCHTALVLFKFETKFYRNGMDTTIPTIELLSFLAKSPY